MSELTAEERVIWTKARLKFEDQRAALMRVAPSPIPLTWQEIGLEFRVAWFTIAAQDLEAAIPDGPPTRPEPFTLRPTPTSLRRIGAV